MPIEELINEIAKRPELYLGEATLSRLDAYLLGWMAAANDDQTEVVMKGFQEWVSDKFRIRSTQSWSNIIRFYAQNDVSALKDALDLFSEYFVLYKENAARQALKLGGE